jgi:CIC family chloride channel protein
MRQLASKSGAEVAIAPETAYSSVMLLALRDQWFRAVTWFNSLGLHENTVLTVFAAAVGAASALGVVLFYKLIDIAFTVFFRIPGDHVARAVFLAYRPLITSLGFVAAWLIMRRVGGGDDGMNVPDVQLAVAKRGGYLPARPAMARTAASAVTLGAGGSAGSEGPVAVLGSAIGSWIGRVFKFNSSQVKVMVGSGAAAGIAAAFNAPLAGAFFALEEVLGTFSGAAFAPVVVSAVIGAVVARAFYGNHPAFPIPEEYGSAMSLEIFVLYPLLGILCGLVAVLFIRTFFHVREKALRWHAHPLLLAALGGALVGLIVYASRGVLVGYGHLAVRVEVFGRMAWYALALLALGKIVATSLTLNLGGSGGVFTPSLYIGAATGGAFGAAVDRNMPGLHNSPEAYALVGMGALVSCATDAPITAILIVFEMTNDYAIVPALMLVIAVAAIVTKKLEPDSLYSGYLRRRGERLPHAPAANTLLDLRVANVMEPAMPITHDTPVRAVLEKIGYDTHADMPVVDEKGEIVGVITMADLARVAREHQLLDNLVIAADLIVPTEVVLPQDPLLSAIEKMAGRGINALPVQDPATGKLLGIVSRARIMSAYERSVFDPEGLR